MSKFGTSSPQPLVASKTSRDLDAIQRQHERLLDESLGHSAPLDDFADNRSLPASNHPFQCENSERRDSFTHPRRSLPDPGDHAVAERFALTSTFRDHLTYRMVPELCVIEEVSQDVPYASMQVI